MRNTRDYSTLRYRKNKRRRARRGHDGPVGEFWLLVVVGLCILGAARLDYIAQRDCGANQQCLNAVMP